MGSCDHKEIHSVDHWSLIWSDCVADDYCHDYNHSLVCSWCLNRLNVNSALFRPVVYRTMARRRKGLGQRRPPNWKSRLGCSPSAMEKENLWRREVKKRNSSILASCSPRHTRFPEDGKHAREAWWHFSLSRFFVWNWNVEKLQSLDLCRQIDNIKTKDAFGFFCCWLTCRKR